MLLNFEPVSELHTQEYYENRWETGERNFFRHNYHPTNLIEFNPLLKRMLLNPFGDKRPNRPVSSSLVNVNEKVVPLNYFYRIYRTINGEVFQREMLDENFCEHIFAQVLTLLELKTYFELYESNPLIDLPSTGARNSTGCMTAIDSRLIDIDSLKQCMYHLPQVYRWQAAWLIPATVREGDFSIEVEHFFSGEERSLRVAEMLDGIDGVFQKSVRSLHIGQSGVDSIFGRPTIPVMSRYQQIYPVTLVGMNALQGYFSPIVEARKGVNEHSNEIIVKVPYAVYLRDPLAVRVLKYTGS